MNVTARSIVAAGIVCASICSFAMPVLGQTDLEGNWEFNWPHLDQTLHDESANGNNSTDYDGANDRGIGIRPLHQRRGE